MRIKYIKNSFEGKPSFLIELDGVEYISNGCVFKENTENTRNALIRKYECEEYLTELLNAPWGDISSVTDARSMFYGCTSLTKFNGDISSVTDARCMFDDCTSLTEFNGDMSSVTNAWCMFNGCTSLTEFNGDMSSVTDVRYMFNGCTSLVRK